MSLGGMMFFSSTRLTHDVVIQPGREVKVLRIEGVKVFVELL